MYAKTNSDLAESMSYAASPHYSCLNLIVTFSENCAFGGCYNGGECHGNMCTCRDGFYGNRCENRLVCLFFSCVLSEAFAFKT